MADGNREPVRTVTSKVLAILEAFEKSRGALSLTDVAEKSGLPLSTAHRLVNELIDWGFLSREPNGRYQLGIRLWELAQMRISREEIFGPVICILKYDDAGGSADEAVALANNTEFGLGGLGFGGDPDTALAVADRMDTGTVGITLLRLQPRRTVRRPARLRPRHRIRHRGPERVPELQVDPPQGLKPRRRGPMAPIRRPRVGAK